MSQKEIPYFTPYNLSIGDWVMINKQKAKVRFIDDYGDVGLNLGNPSDETPCLISELRPIPLTSEILMKNGFKHTGIGFIIADINFANIEGGGQLIWDGGRIETFVHFSKHEFAVCQCEYVHMLQHFLQVIGVEKDIEL